MRYLIEYNNLEVVWVHEPGASVVALAIGNFGLKTDSLKDAQTQLYTQGINTDAITKAIKIKEESPE